IFLEISKKKIIIFLNSKLVIKPIILKNFLVAVVEKLNKCRNKRSEISATPKIIPAHPNLDKLPIQACLSDFFSIRESFFLAKVSNPSLRIQQIAIDTTE